MKKQICALLVLTLMLSLFSFPASAEETDITITVNGNPVQFTDAYPFIDENGRTLVPLRAVADAMGVEVEWDEMEQAAIFTRYFDHDERYHYKDEDYEDWLTRVFTIFHLGSPEVYSEMVYSTGAILMLHGTHIHNGDEIMDTVPVLVNDRTYAPVRYLAENLGFDVLWDGETQTITIVDELVYNFYYSFDFVEDSIFTLALSNYENISSIEITKLLVARHSDVSSFDYMNKPCEFTVFTPDQMRENEQFQPRINELANSTELLGGLQAYLENPDDIRIFEIEYRGVKPNGATFTGECVIPFHI